MLGRDEFLESFKYLATITGLTGVLEEARAQGQDGALDIEVQGARQLKLKIPEAGSGIHCRPLRGRNRRTACAHAVKIRMR
jgi:guanylate kinase